MVWPTNDSKKQSAFTTVTEVPSGAYFGVFGNSANYKISYENMLSSFGVSGSLEQLGASGQPLLYQAAGTNYIRNIKAGLGVTLTQEPTDEVSISVSYTFDEVGVPLVADTASLSPTFRSLVEGGGISIAGALDEITVSGYPKRALLYIPTNSTETVISSSGVPVAVNAVFSGVIAENFTIATTGIATYTGRSSEMVSVTAAASIKPASGTKGVSLSLALNGTEIAASRSYTEVDSSRGRGITCVWMLELAESDTLQLFVGNYSDTVNLVVESATLRIE